MRSVSDFQQIYLVQFCTLQTIHKRIDFKLLEVWPFFESNLLGVMWQRFPKVVDYLDSRKLRFCQ